jgi:ABC-type amino acid transport substrate-binding protein
MLEKRTDLAELKLYTSNEAEFSDLIAGRVDAVVEDDLKINLYLKAHPDAGMEMATGYMPQSEELGYARFGVRKEDVDLNHALSRAIDEMRGDGTLRSILAEFNFTDRNLWSYPTK